MSRSTDTINKGGPAYSSLQQHDRDNDRSAVTTTSPQDRGYLGWRILNELNRDAWLLMGSKAVRLYSYGYLAVILVIYLQSLPSMTDASIGLLFTGTLLGDAMISLYLTSHADHIIGRKNTLLIGSAIAITTSIVFATSANFTVLLLTGILGVISPSGSEMGPFMAIELSSLSQVTTDAQRTYLMAWYNLFGSLSSALGALSCGIIVTYLMHSGYDLRSAGSSVLMLYATVQTLQFIMFAFLSSAIEVPATTTANGSVKSPRESQGFLGLHKSKWIVFQLSLLFMLDSFAGSFVLQSIISAWFYDRYHTASTTLGTIVFNCNIAAGVSALFAAQIAGQIGLVLTMVVTHLPSNVLLILVPLMPNETLAIVMICLRYCISQMDVPTRNAYVQGVVDPDERSAANGITNVVRSIGASIGPYLCGLLLASENPSYKSYPFYIAGGLKIVYDLLLLWKFRALQSTSDTHLQNKPPQSAATNTTQPYQLASNNDEEEVIELIVKK